MPGGPAEGEEAASPGRSPETSGYSRAVMLKGPPSPHRERSRSREIIDENWDRFSETIELDSALRSLQYAKDVGYLRYIEDVMYSISKCLHRSRQRGHQRILGRMRSWAPSSEPCDARSNQLPARSTVNAMSANGDGNGLHAQEEL